MKTALPAKVARKIGRPRGSKDTRPRKPTRFSAAIIVSNSHVPAIPHTTSASEGDKVRDQALAASACADLEHNRSSRNVEDAKRRTFPFFLNVPIGCDIDE